MQWITQLISLILIRWIMIYPVDRTIQRFNNQSQEIRIAGDERSRQSITSIIPSSEITVKWLL